MFIYLFFFSILNIFFFYVRIDDHGRSNVLAAAAEAYAPVLPAIGKRDRNARAWRASGSTAITSVW